MNLVTAVKKIDNWIADLMHKYSFVLLRYSLAVVYIWFGLLKPLGMSPAAELISHTVVWVSPDWFVPFLGWWEAAIGFFLLFRKTIRLALFLLFMLMPGMFAPLIFLPEVTFTHFPYGLTMEGQYIIKDIILLAAAITVGGTVNRRPSEEEVM